MTGKRFTEEQIIGILNESEQIGNTRKVCKLHSIIEQPFYRLRTRSIGLDAAAITTTTEALSEATPAGPHRFWNPR